MDLKKIHTVYFIGIGGIGMSAIARYFKTQGKCVAGYDKTKTSLTDELLIEGMDVHFNDDLSLLNPETREAINHKENVLVVYTPAVPKDHSELHYFKNNGYTIKKRAEVLGLITSNTFTIAVGGTHGKTTTSSIIAHLLKSSGHSIAAFLGGITQNYDTNFLISENPEYVVVEADEYDRSFLTLHPDIAVITSMDPDHLDIYNDDAHVKESFNLFAQQVKPGGRLIISVKAGKNLKPVDRIVSSYSVTDEGDYYASEIKIVNGIYHFNLHTSSGIISNLAVGLPGLHNVENAVAAAAVAQSLNLTNEQIIAGLKSFKGVKRRFDYQIKSKNLIYIDDYAHHPEELKACINSVRELYPDKKITGVFQPHLFSRTRDFADGFAKSLELLDEIILLEIYPARELPIEGINSSWLLDKINSKHKIISSKDELVKELSKRHLEVVLTLGAGDIDTLVEPIREQLSKQYLNPLYNA